MLKFSLLLLVAGSSLCGQTASYLQVCKQSDGPWPDCKSVRVGGGLELVDDEIRVVPSSSRGYEIEFNRLVYSGADVVNGKPYTIPDQFQDQAIVSVYWGDRVLTQVSVNTLPECPICWAPALEGDGKKAILFNVNKQNQIDRQGWAIGVSFVRLKER